MSRRQQVATPAPRLLITGAGGDLGRELVRQATRRGWSVTRHLHAEPTPGETSPLVSDPVIGDLHDDSTIDELISAAVAGADVLILNAADTLRAELSRYDRSRIQAQFDVNVAAPMGIALGMLREHHHPEQVTVVVISSITAIVPTPGNAVYGATKAAISYLTSALRLECNAETLTVVTGPFASEPSQLDPFFVQRPWLVIDTSTVARQILDAIARRRHGILIPTWRYRVIIGAMRWLPLSVAERLGAIAASRRSQ